MGGSFESGAGDSPDDLFGDDDDSEAVDEDVDVDSQEPSPESAQDAASDTASDSAERSTAETTADSSADAETDDESDSETGVESEDTTTAMLDLDSETDLDAAQLAQAFVPDSYEKPHPWALGRDGVNDGRPEKKTFFLQSEVLDLEEACRDEVNEILDGDVPLTDLRELALIVAYHQPELLAKAAREWGSESA